MNKCVAVALVLLLAGCGDSPTAPSPSPTPMPGPAPATGPANIAGAWPGLLAGTFQGRRFSVDTRAELIQNDRIIMGTWIVTVPAANDIRGEITGTLDGIGAEMHFSGTVTWDSAQEGASGRCAGRARFSGPSTSVALRWESPRFEFDNCSDPPTDLLWTMQPPANRPLATLQR